MPTLYGRRFSREELLRYVGNMDQLGGVRRFELQDGKERGVEGIEFRTGSGLNFLVVPGRGMDIAHAEYNGIPLCWHSATGIVNPAFFEPEGFGWLRSFYGGLVVTCGLSYAGAPCEDRGKPLGLHGRISNTPAERVCIDTGWDGDEYYLKATGELHESSVFGENLVLRRQILARLGEAKILIHDKVTNHGFEPAEHMILYHINFGFPVVSPSTELVSPSIEVTPRDADAQVEKEKFNTFLPPTQGFKERCYYHKMACDAEGYIWAGLINRDFGRGEGFGAYIKYPKDELPEFTEWKMNGQGTYVVGLEPGNCRVEGRHRERERGTLVFLAPGETREYHIEIGVMNSAEAIGAFEEKVRSASGGRAPRVV